VKRWIATALLSVGLIAATAAPAAADPAWKCSANPGWVAAGSRGDAPGAGGEPCPITQTGAQPAGASGATLTASGSVAVDGGQASQTTDTRKPQASVDLRQLTIRNPDGSLVLTAARIIGQAQGSCDANRNPQFTSSSSLDTVTLNGRPVDTRSDYSEPGVGVNGAPLLGKITIKFGEVAAGDAGLERRALHLIVTDKDGNVVFEAVAGDVTAGRDGAVCEPPPVCPPGTQPQQGRCVDVTVTPLPPPPAPPPPLPPPPSGGGGPTPHPSPSPSPSPRTRGCADTAARVGQVPDRRLVAATLCLMNVQRRRHHLRRLRLSRQLSLAAARHVRSMIAGRYFAHDEPAGPTFLDRVLHSGYLQRYGRWSIGENLGWGWGSGGTPRAMVAAWMRSPPHRRNILNARFRDVGIALRAGTPRPHGRRQSITYVIDFGGFQLVGRA